MKKFTYKDISKKIPEWPFYGEKVRGIICDDIDEADDWFAAAHPEYIVKGKLSNVLTVTIEKYEQN